MLCDVYTALSFYNYHSKQVSIQRGKSQHLSLGNIHAKNHFECPPKILFLNVPVNREFETIVPDIILESNW